MQNIDLTPFVQALIALIAAIVARYLIPWLKAKYSAETISKTLTIVETLVTAAQQLAKAEGWDGAKKKEYVIAQLEAAGYEIDSDIDAYIEAKVYDLKNKVLENG